MTKTVLQIKNAAKGWHKIEKGLRYFSKGDGTGRFEFRVTYACETVSLALGDFPDQVSLADARERAAEARSKARRGVDPRKADIDAKADAISAALTFGDVAETALPIFRQEWKCGGKRNGFETKLRTYILPKIGKLPLAEITPDTLVKMVGKMWHTKFPTADKCLLHVSKILKWAKAKGHDCDQFAAQGARRLLGKTTHVETPQAAFDWREMPEHYQSLGGSMQCIAEKFYLLLGVRAANVQYARWDEIDTERWVWTIPRAPTLKEQADHAKRADGSYLKLLGTTKNGQVHEVPLPRQAAELLGRAAQFYDGRDGFIFKNPAARKSGVVSSNNWSKKMRDANVSATAHGARATLKTWAEENGIEDSKVIEESLMHKVRSAQEGVYLRTQLTKRRRAMFQKWADLLSGVTPVSHYDTSAEIIDFSDVFAA